MGLIINKYENEVDKAWYDSSNVIYSECVDNKNDYKDLFVTFKSGDTYHYKNVTVQDYLMFRSDVSQGKALNKFITKKVDGKFVYEYEKKEKKDVSKLVEERDQLLEEKKQEKLNEDDERGEAMEW